MLYWVDSIKTLLNNNDSDKAAALLKKYDLQAQTMNERFIWLILTAKLYLVKNDASEAIKYVQQANTLKFDYLSTPYFLEIAGDSFFARHLNSQLNGEENGSAYSSLALEMYSRILNQFPQYDNLGWVHFQIGTIFVQNNDCQSALQHFHQALLTESYVTTLTAYCYESLGRIAFFEQREFSIALSFLDRAIATFPPNGAAVRLLIMHMLRGNVLRASRRYDQALHEMKLAVDIAVANVDPTNTLDLEVMRQALLAIGESMWQLSDRPSDVLMYLQQFIQIMPHPVGTNITWSRVHEMLGDCHYLLERYQSAIVAYNVAIQANPHSPWESSLHYRVAISYYHLREYGDVIATVQYMIQQCEIHAETMKDYRAYYLMGSAYFILQRYDLAVEAYEKALEHIPIYAQDREKLVRYRRFAVELS